MDPLSSLLTLALPFGLRQGQKGVVGELDGMVEMIGLDWSDLFG